MSAVDRARAGLRLYKLGLNPEVLRRYGEPHRFYHNWYHIQSMLLNYFGESDEVDVEKMNDMLFLAIVFHDIVYDPRRNDNEEQSCELFLKAGGDKLIYAKEVVDAIMCTADPMNRIGEHTTLGKELVTLDLAILKAPMKMFMDYDYAIFKEYQWVPFEKYKIERYKVLTNLDVDDERVRAVDYRLNNMKLAVYPGSFNPMHIGHLDVLRRAENIFDKVILARGVNPAKSTSSFTWPKAVQYRECAHYTTLLSEYLDSLMGHSMPVTLVRGFRNGRDIEEHKDVQRWLNDLECEVDTAYFMCDLKYEHVSSSAIKQLQTFEKGEDGLYVPGGYIVK